MAETRLSCVDRRGRRRWSFAGCVFDEANWTLTVDGRRAAVESKPLELLRELLLHAGNLVSKDEMMDRIWPDVAVVEASLPTAIGKLRRALNDDRRDRPIIETVPRIGYRLAVPVEVEEIADESSATVTAPHPPPFVDRRRVVEAPTRRRDLVLAGSLMIAAAATAWGLAPFRQAVTTAEAKHYSHRDVFTALRKADVDTIERMLAAGWDPNASLDKDRNNALDVLVNNCEWDPGHDRRQMLLAARTLLDGGQRLTDRNAWGDTPYSIAKADRYCGPRHPVTVMIWRMCKSGGSLNPDLCLADYHRDSSGTIVRQ